jgi:hypothetical protein
VAAIKALMREDLKKKKTKLAKKKGAGIKVGAGVKVGAGFSVGAGVKKKGCSCEKKGAGFRSGSPPKGYRQKPTKAKKSSKPKWHAHHKKGKGPLRFAFSAASQRFAKDILGKGAGLKPGRRRTRKASPEENY